MLVALNRADYRGPLKACASGSRLFAGEREGFIRGRRLGLPPVVSIKRSTAFRIYGLPCGAECKGVMRWRIFYLTRCQRRIWEIARLEAVACLPRPAEALRAELHERYGVFFTAVCEGTV